jgi:hypothetical protein
MSFHQYHTTKTKGSHSVGLMAALSTNTKRACIKHAEVNSLQLRHAPPKQAVSGTVHWHPASSFATSQ